MDGEEIDLDTPIPLRSLREISVKYQTDLRISILEEKVTKLGEEHRKSMQEHRDSMRTHGGLIRAHGMLMTACEKLEEDSKRDKAELEDSLRMSESKSKGWEDAYSEEFSENANLIEENEELKGKLEETEGAFEAASSKCSEIRDTHDSITDSFEDIESKFWWLHARLHEFDVFLASDDSEKVMMGARAKFDKLQQTCVEIKASFLMIGPEVRTLDAKLKRLDAVLKPKSKKRTRDEGEDEPRGDESRKRARGGDWFLE